MLEDNSTFIPAEVNPSEKFTGGYVYLTRVQTSKAVLWYAGKKHRAEFDPTYFGSGRVVSNVCKKYGVEVFRTEPLGWADTLSELNQLEKDVIVWCRAEFGKLCVNKADGGDGFTPETARKMHASPSIKVRHSAAMKASHAIPEIKARRAAAIKFAHSRPEVKVRNLIAAKVRLARPEVKARLSASNKAAHSRSEVKIRHSNALKTFYSCPKNKARLAEALKTSHANPEIKARRAASIKAAHANPEVKARHSASMKYATKTTIEASAIFRAEWFNTIKPNYLAVGIEPPKAPNSAAKAETWKQFVEKARVLLNGRTTNNGENEWQV